MVTEKQQEFLEQLALRIPRLFEAIRQGNIKSEYIIGVRCIESRHVRLKIVAEVVDAGSNPLATHGMLRSEQSPPEPEQKNQPSCAPAARRRRPGKR